MLSFRIHEEECHQPMKKIKKTDLADAACAVAFIAVLAISAYWERGIRVLHLFESLIYWSVAILCLRQIKFGYLLGVATGAFWLWTGGFLTTFVRNGFERLATLLRTGSVDRFDILLAVPAAIASGGPVLFSLAGYASLPNKSWRDAGLFLAALVLVAAFFVGIFAAFAPQYLGMFRGILKK